MPHTRPALSTQPLGLRWRCQAGSHRSEAAEAASTLLCGHWLLHHQVVRAAGFHCWPPLASSGGMARPACCGGRKCRRLSVRQLLAYYTGALLSICLTALRSSAKHAEASA